MVLFNKQGAMFGLDARIALAIFGALSVISGAALYSAIQQAKVTAVITELNEIGKAYDAYYLDTGEELVLSPSSGSIYLEIDELLSSSKKNWQGPYLSYEKSSKVWLKHPKYFGLMIEELKDGAWAGNTNADWENANCVTGLVTGTCYVWAGVGLEEKDSRLVDLVDMQIDGTVDSKTGSIRSFVSSGGYHYIFLKLRASKRY